MKELVTEEQANLIILFLSIAVSVVSLGVGFYLHSKTSKSQRKLLWAQVAVSVLLGPVVWIFWKVYNSIENYYGLDSLKALKYNFFIAIGLGAIFFALFTFVPRWVQERPSTKRSK